LFVLVSPVQLFGRLRPFFFVLLFAGRVFPLRSPRLFFVFPSVARGSKEDGFSCRRFFCVLQERPRAPRTRTKHVRSRSCSRGSQPKQHKKPKTMILWKEREDGKRWRGFLVLSFSFSLFTHSAPPLTVFSSSAIIPTHHKTLRRRSREPTSPFLLFLCFFRSFFFWTGEQERIGTSDAFSTNPT